MSELLCADLFDCMTPLKGKPLLVKRLRPTPLQYGRRTKTAAAEEFRIEAAVQPLVTRDNKSDPEGDRNEGKIVIWSEVILLTQKTSEGVEGDHVVWEGVEYEVYSSRDWRQTAGFVRSEAERVPF